MLFHTCISFPFGFLGYVDPYLWQADRIKQDRHQQEHQVGHGQIRLEFNLCKSLHCLETLSSFPITILRQHDESGRCIRRIG